MRVARTLALLAVVIPAPLAAQRARTDTAALQRLLVAEDARGTGADGIAPMVEGLASRDPLMRRVAVRGVGRLQRPDVGLRLLPLLSDASADIRAEAANGIAQSLRRARRGPAADDPSQLTVTSAQRALSDALGREKDPRTAGIIARSLGRLVLPDSTAAREAERAIVAKGQWQPSYDLMHGLFRIAQSRRFTGNPSQAAVDLMRRTATTSADAPTRRLAILALRTAAALDGPTVLAAARDRDAQVRRLSLAGVAVLSLTDRAAVQRAAFADPSVIVRIDAIAASRVGSEKPDCAGIVAATRDAEPYVRQIAADALGSACADSAAAVSALVAAIESRAPVIVDHRWQLRGHALVALAKRDAARARQHVDAAMGSSVALERVYAAKAAGAMSDTARLIRMAADRDHNVMEAAIAELARVAKRSADSVFVRGLASKGNQVVLASAQALAGSRHERALPALLDGLDALTATKTENVRDPRVAILKRIEEVGSATDAARLRPYLTDYDTTVAETVAGMIGKWTGETVSASPKPLPIRAEPLARTFLARNVRLRVTMAPSSGGGSFTLRLFSDEAPATVARYVRLAREHYFDGHQLQRVEPNFVIQGGGPDASEYVGEATFMRDEVSARPHLRGTAGVSSRGRDTGDDGTAGSPEGHAQAEQLLLDILIDEPDRVFAGTRMQLVVHRQP